MGGDTMHLSPPCLFKQDMDLSPLLAVGFFSSSVYLPRAIVIISCIIPRSLDLPYNFPAPI